MNEESILKQSLLLTGKLLGAVAVWVTLVSLVAVTITTRVVVSLTGRSEDSSEKASAAGGDARGQLRSAPAANPTKPNG